MAWSGAGVNVGAWSLSIGAVSAGCGPLIPADGDTDAGSPDDDEGDTDAPYSDTDETYTSTIPDDTDWQDCPGGCPPGYYCLYGSCISDYGCDPADCCRDECYYDECAYAEDCGAGSFCSDGYDYGAYCYAAEELALCESGDLLGRTIALPPDAAGGALALAFADVEAGGGAELLLVQWNEARLVTAGGASTTAALPLPDAGADVWATAIPNEGGFAFVVSTPSAGGARRVTFEGDALVVGPLAPVAIERIAGGDFDGDGFGDVAGLVAETLVWLRGGDVEFSEAVEVHGHAFGPVATASFDFDGLTDIAFHEPNGATAYVTDVSAPRETVELVHSRAVQQTVVAADLDDDGSVDLAGLTRSGDTMLMVAWRYNWTVPGFVVQTPVWAPDLETDAGGSYRVAAGDLDDDGGQDVIIGGDAVLRIAFGDPTGFEGFRCYADVPIAHAATTVAVGDLDGDGRPDVAFSDGMATTVLAQE